MPPAATACQLWAEVPGTQVAVDSPVVGTTQLTSPTSVDPPPAGSTPNSAISASEPSGQAEPPTNESWIFMAKARSASVYSTPPTLRRLASITCPRATLGTRSYSPWMTSYSIPVPVPIAAPSAARATRSNSLSTVGASGCRT